jgi:hypothetical protein
VDPVAVALKFGFLAVLYLFLLWVARSVLRDLRRAPGGFAGSGGRPDADPEATSAHHAAAALDGDADGEPRLLVEFVPGVQTGSWYEIRDGATLGRGNVEIQLEDPYASGRHARLERQGAAVVLEDLGSTNGTYLNGEMMRGPQALHDGDRIRIGDSEFSFQGH